MPRVGTGNKAFSALRSHVRVLVGIPLLPAALRAESEPPLKKATRVLLAMCSLAEQAAVADSEFPEWLEAPLALQAFTGNIPVLPNAPLLAEPVPPKRQYLKSRACDRDMSEHKQALRVEAKRARELNSSCLFCCMLQVHCR